MPADDWHLLIAVVLGIVVLFAVVVATCLRVGTRNRSKALQEVEAREVLGGAGLSGDLRGDLLYGLWQVQASRVLLHVRDGNDSDVATLIQGPMGGAEFTLGDESYAVLVTSGWRESAILVRSGEHGTDLEPACRCEIRGWGGGRIARYTLQDGRAISVHADWSAPWNRRPLPILEGTGVIGQLLGIGKVANAGRAVVLPASIPLAVRLFVLYKAVGARH